MNLSPYATRSDARSRAEIARRVCRAALPIALLAIAAVMATASPSTGSGPRDHDSGGNRGHHCGHDCGLHLGHRNRGDDSKPETPDSPPPVSPQPKPADVVPQRKPGRRGSSGPRRLPPGPPRVGSAPPPRLPPGPTAGSIGPQELPPNAAAARRGKRRDGRRDRDAAGRRALAPVYASEPPATPPVSVARAASTPVAGAHVPGLSLGLLIAAIAALGLLAVVVLRLRPAWFRRDEPPAAP